MKFAIPTLYMYEFTFLDCGVDCMCGGSELVWPKGEVEIVRYRAK